MTDFPNGLAQKVLVILAGTLTLMGTAMVAPIFPEMGAHFSSSPNALFLLQVAIAGPSLAIAFVSPLSGWLTDRFGRKNIMLLAILLFSLLGTAPIFATQLTTIVVFRLLLGCAEAITITCCMSLMADYWKGEERAKVLSWQIISMSLAGAALASIGGAFGEASWTRPFYLYLAPLLLIPFMWIFLREPAGNSIREIAHPGIPDKTHIKPVLVGNFTIFIVMVMVFLIHLQMPRLLTNIGITSSLKIGLTAGADMVAGIAGSLLMAPLVRRIGAAGCNFIVFALFATAITLFYRAETHGVLVIAAILHGVASGLGTPNAIAPVMAALSRKDRGLGMGMNMSLLYLGQFFSPLIVIWLGHMTGGVSGGLCGALAWLSGFCVLYALVWLAVSMKERVWSPSYREPGI
ncbi:arabinose efflux permease family protein [Burkholderia sp. Ch1-1]|nr:arabinose efflux permease family protein [Burkholderia sp. Ch1-1]